MRFAYREHRRKWEEVRLACEERRAFLEAEMDRIRAQEEKLRQFREEMKGDWVAEVNAIQMANNQLAKLDSMVPAGAVGSWALETSAACSCQGACNCIQVRRLTDMQSSSLNLYLVEDYNDGGKSGRGRG